MILEAEAPAHAEPFCTAMRLLGDSAEIATLRGLIRQFANTPFPVLIEGESGSGKELVAECLHRESDRAQFPMLTINCAAFNAELLEAQLFGHRRGAFTGAAEERNGFFAVAHRGTLFLDEVGDMPPEVQTKFLRVLESGEYYPLGETRPRHSTARVIAATNRNLREAVRTGAFRPDLFHRLSVLTVSVPPLRARGEDWALLLESFQKQYAASVAPFKLDDAARALLRASSFPGNVRELRNIVIRLGAKYPGRTVTAEQLGAELEPSIGAGPATSEQALTDEAVLAALLRDGFRLDAAIAAIERRYVEVALQKSGGNLSQAARLLGINRTTLYNRLQRLGLEP
jgi:DNA-binding NtrC family response regulator